MRRTIPLLLSLLLVAFACLTAAACGGSHEARRAPLPTAPALDGTTPADTSHRGGPTLGGGG